jgi:hypothetical protein
MDALENRHTKASGVNVVPVSQMALGTATRFIANRNAGLANE